MPAPDSEDGPDAVEPRLGLALPNEEAHVEEAVPLVGRHGRLACCPVPGEVLQGQNLLIDL